MICNINLKLKSVEKACKRMNKGIQVSLSNVMVIGANVRELTNWYWKFKYIT